MSNPTVDVQQYGQSLWYDNIGRDMIQNGALQKLIDESGVMGVTSNPTIFERAISEGNLYDKAIAEGMDVEASVVFDRLAIDDIQHAADLLRPVYDRTGGVDGYVSLEVSPLLANDTATTLSEAQRLFGLVNRPNLMIKIPGTSAGLHAIEEALFSGINVNVTLLFAVDNYAEVAERYITALERRLDAGLPVDKIASVASFFLSRIDTVVDKQLEENIQAGRHVAESQQLLHQAAIANAKVAYLRFKDLFYGERFSRLRAAGARVQRPLWASTGTKNPQLSDVYYMNALIGPDTVNTVPHATLVAFKDHGVAAPTLDKDLPAAQAILDQLATAGIDMTQVTTQLQLDGVTSFVTSFKKLIDGIEAKRKQLA